MNAVLLLVLLGLIALGSSQLINLSNSNFLGASILIEGTSSTSGETGTITNCHIESTSGDVTVRRLQTVVSSGNNYTANSGVYLVEIDTGSFSSDTANGGNVGFDVRLLTSTNGRYTVNGGYFDFDYSDTQVLSSTGDIIRQLQSQSDLAYLDPDTSGTITNAQVSGFFSTVIALSTVSQTTVSSNVLQFQSSTLNDFTFTALGNCGGSNTVEVVAGDNRLNNAQFLDMPCRFIVDSVGYYSASSPRLYHSGGTNVWTFSNANYLNRLSTTGPEFPLGATSGYWLLTGNTYYFYCFDISQSDDYTVIRTPSNQNCVFVDGFEPSFYCYDYGKLYFLPIRDRWYADSYESTNDYGPRFCGATSTLRVANDPYVIDGVSFRDTVKFLLTQTFTVGDLPLPRVTTSDFYINNGHIARIRQLTTDVPGAKREVNAVVTHVYEITVVGNCDGFIELDYRGMVASDYSWNRAGFNYIDSGIIYAGCLGNQFCV